MAAWLDEGEDEGGMEVERGEQRERKGDEREGGICLPV